MGNIFISDKEAKGLKNFMKQQYGFELAPKETVVLQEDSTFLDLRIFDKNSAKARYLRRIKKEHFSLSKDAFTRLQLESFKHIDPIKHVFNLDDEHIWFLLGGAERPTLREDLHRREHLAQPFTEDTLIPMLTAMAKGLAELQQIGIAHQAIEPRVWILDFNNTARLTHYRVTTHLAMPSLGKGDNKNQLDHYLTFSSAGVLRDENEAEQPKEDSYNFGRVAIMMMLIGRRTIKYDDILDEYQSFMAFPKAEKHKSVIGGFIEKIGKLRVFSRHLVMLLENILSYEREERIDPLSIREYLQLCKKWDEAEAQQFLATKSKKEVSVSGGAGGFHLRSSSANYSSL